MVAGVVFPQNSDSVLFSLDYHNTTAPGDRSHHDSRPETRHHRPGQGRQQDDNEYYTRLFAKAQSYRSMLRILGH